MNTLAPAILTLTLLCLCTPLIADTFGTGENQFEIEFVEIGDPGNDDDPTAQPHLRQPNPAGSVDYIYKMGKYEVSRDMVDKANAEGGLGLTLDPMDFVTGGPRPNMPATGISWNEAARFTNWLNTSQGFTAAYKFGAKPGDAAYDANANIELWVDGDPGFDDANPFRNSQAHYFLPTLDEWYKSAYYDPNANDGAGGYWNFPTGSDTAPVKVANGTAPNTAVYEQSLSLGPADITQAGGLSPYGVMGLGGNVLEWEETQLFFERGPSVDELRSVRGGVWNFVSGDVAFLSADLSRGSSSPTREDRNIGFRVASVPEPSTGMLGFLGMLVVGFMQRTRRSRQRDSLPCR